MTNQSDAKNNGTSKFDIFISYASDDKDKAFEICESLETRGIRCWIAPRNIRAGKEYSEEIIKGIEASKSLLVVLSESANNSKFVKLEVERAVSSGKPVYPFRIEDVKPSSSLELFISSTHWIEAWQGNLIEHIDKLVDELKQVSDELFVHNIKDLPLVDKLLRFVQRNLNAVITISVVVLLGIVMFGGNDMPDMGPDDVEDLELKHFTIVMKPTGNELESNKFSFGISMNNSPNTWKENDLNGSVYHLEFDEGTELSATSSRASFYQTIKLTDIPTELTFSFETKDNEVAGPFEYDLSFLESDILAHKNKILKSEQDNKKRQLTTSQERIKEGLVSGHKFRCYKQNSMTICKLSTNNDMELYQSVVDAILIGASSKKLDLKIDIDDLKSTKKLAVYKSSGGEWYFLFAANSNSIHYQASFKDGSSTKIIESKMKNFTKDNVFELTPLDPRSPIAYATVRGVNYYSQNHKWNIYPIVGDEVNSISWSVFEGVQHKASRTRENIHTIEEKSEFLGFNAKSKGNPNNQIAISFTYGNGLTSVYKYRLNWEEWIEKSAINSVKYEELIDCQTTDQNSANFEYAKMSCSTREYGPIFTDILWGLTPQNLRSIKEYDSDKMRRLFISKTYKDFNQERFDILLIKSENNNLNKKELKELKQLERSKRNLDNKLASFDSRVRTAPITEKHFKDGKAIQLTFHEHAQNLFFKFLKTDGTESTLIQVPVRQ